MRSLWLGITGAVIGISVAVAENGPLPASFDEIQTIVEAVPSVSPLLPFC